MTDEGLVVNTHLRLETYKFNILSNKLIADWIRVNDIKTFIHIINDMRLDPNLLDRVTDEELRTWITSYLNSYMEVTEKNYSSSELEMFTAYIFYMIKNALLMQIPDSENAVIKDKEYIETLLARETEIGTEEWFCQSELLCQLLISMSQDMFFYDYVEEIEQLIVKVEAESEDKRIFEETYIN